MEKVKIGSTFLLKIAHKIYWNFTRLSCGHTWPPSGLFKLHTLIWL